MKKLIVLTSLSVAGLILSGSEASAWWWCHHDNKCCTTICVRPYNAFSPVCCGNLNCNGCCPLNVTQGCCGQAGCGYGGCGYGPTCGYGQGYGYGCGAACGGYGYAPGYGGDSGYALGQLPVLDATQQRSSSLAATPTTPAQPATPAFQAPMPAPKAGPTSYIPGLQSSALPVPPAPVQLAGYHPQSNRVMAPLTNAFNGN